MGTRIQAVTAYIVPADTMGGIELCLTLALCALICLATYELMTKRR